MPTSIQVGDRVLVLDPALAELRSIMRDATGQEPAPNHHGIVESVSGNTVVIVFDDGGAAPYLLGEVRHLQGED